MKRFAILGMALVGLSAVLAAPAGAAICSQDNELAATLLLPYFEVDLDARQGLTTLMTIGNGHPAPRLANVVVWSDLGIPVLNFTLYLTGYDVHSLNLRDLFFGDVAQITGPTVTPAGPFSDPNSDFPHCETFFPGPPALPSQLLEHMRTSLTGQPSATFSGRCSGRDLGDAVARGYVTVNVVEECSAIFPDDEGYFGPGGILGFDNVLFGEYYYVDVANSFAQGENLVRLRADPGAFEVGDLTFYGSLVGYDASDAREPLTQRWGARYLLGEPLSLETDLVIWRDSTSADRAPFDCGTLPSWYPLSQQGGGVIAFDEQENAADPTGCPVCSPPFFVHVAPASAQRLSLSTDLFLPYTAGWFSLDLSQPVEAPMIPPLPVSADQAFVVSLISADGKFSVGFDATPLDNGCRTLNLPFN